METAHEDFKAAIAEPTGPPGQASSVNTYQNMAKPEQVPSGFGGLQPAAPQGTPGVAVSGNVSNIPLQPNIYPMSAAEAQTRHFGPDPWHVGMDPWGGTAQTSVQLPLRSPTPPPPTHTPMVAMAGAGTGSDINLQTLMQQMSMMQEQLAKLASSQQSSSSLSIPSQSMRVPPEQMNKLLGPAPVEYAWWSQREDKDKEPVPKWDGKNPGLKLKPWLKQLRIWRQETAIPVSKHGLKLYRSFESGSWLKSAADRVPEEALFTEKAWGLILTEILNNLKPYLDVETEVLIEEVIFTTTKDSKETMSSYIARKVNKKIDMVSAFGSKKKL